MYIWLDSQFDNMREILIRGEEQSKEQQRALQSHASGPPHIGVLDKLNDHTVLIERLNLHTTSLEKRQMKIESGIDNIQVEVRALQLIFRDLDKPTREVK